MSEHQQQIFDGSFFESLLAAPALPDAPPEIEIETSAESLEMDGLDEIESFDWDGYNRAFFERIPDSAKRSEDGQRMAEIAGTQIWMSRRLPQDVVHFLLRLTPVKLLWVYINRDEREELLKTATRGFQRTPQIVRQPAVRNRLLHWFEQNPAEIYILLVMWSFNEPQPPIIGLALGEKDNADLKHKLPSLVRKFGVEATIAGLAVAAKPRAFRALVDLMADEDEFARLLQNDDGEEEEELIAVPEVVAHTEESAPQPDSEAAHFWKAQFEASEAKREEVCETLEKLQDVNQRFSRIITVQKDELEVLKKHEKVSASHWEKKLEATQKRLQGEIDELKKNLERQGRKFRATERDKAELEVENRRSKKQLRNTGLLLEEERRKVASEGKESKEKEEKAAAKVQAILTPSASQSAPNKPVVVQSPTPLDEIFEWKADGRPVKITPRAVRRLIDANNEDAVFTIMQALESLKHSDRAMYNKFLKRLGEASTYYAHVLTERTTRVLVDASNVARHTLNRYGKGQLRFLWGMREELRRLNCFPILFYADASLPYFIDDPKHFREVVDRGEILMVDKGVEADEILAREARRSGAYVVTNDAKFFHKVSPDFEPPRISFRIYDGTVIVDDF